MILQKQKGKMYKGKQYPKWVIVIPKNDVEKMGWEEGMELEGIIANDMYILKKVG